MHKDAIIHKQGLSLLIYAIAVSACHVNEEMLLFLYVNKDGPDVNQLSIYLYQLLNLYTISK